MPEIAKKPEAKRNKGGNPNWRKGMPCPNPSGRKPLPQDFVAACKAGTLDALANLQRWQRSSNPAASVKASQIILAYGLGQPHQTMTLDGMKQDIINVTFANANQPTSPPPDPAEGTGIESAIQGLGLRTALG